MEAFEGASNAALQPHKLEGTMAFMLETRFPQRVTRYAAELPERQADYVAYGAKLQKHFNPDRREV
jgi:homogentisate 1,2-dioxygenase